ncbi:SprT-like domain-containing protein [Madurella fahalii]|uniref:SprT-like domain-containing protein n=1 Tax=Madurella fahalii TaxID=1157608 RepID=A0ABQ0FZ34_9PEZI
MPRKLYWIDQSCDVAAGGNFEAYILEARQWAKRAVMRLCSDTDTDFARVFNVIFKTPKTDKVPCSKSSFWQTVNGIQSENEWMCSSTQVYNILHDFAFNWARTSDRLAADVRIYANTGLYRWSTAPDGSRYDPINHVYLTGDWDNLITGQAFTSWRVPEFESPPPYNPRFGNPRRVTIDICPSAWEPAIHGIPRTLSKLDPFSLFQKGPGRNPIIGPFAESFISRLIFHEFMHCQHYLLDDHPRDMETSGWSYCMRRKKGAAATCAESLAMLGLWAGLADTRPKGYEKGGFTLDRGWDLIPGSRHDEEEFSDDEKQGEKGSKWDANWPGPGGNKAVKGVIRFYKDITQ